MLAEKILKTNPPDDAPSLSPAIWRRGFRDGLRSAAALAAEQDAEVAELRREVERLREAFLAERKAREGDLRTLQCIAQAYVCNKSADYADEQLKDYETKTAALVAFAALTPKEE